MVGGDGRRSAPGRVEWASVGLFLALTFALAWACFIGLRVIGVPFNVRSSMGMFAPAVSALLTRWIRHEPFAELGLMPTERLWYYLIGYLAPLLLFAAGLVLAVLAGYQHWELLRHWQRVMAVDYRRVQPSTAARLHRLSGLLLLVQLGSAATIAVAINCVFTLGEELGWRGHLLPRLAPLGGTAAALVVGVIWGLWHAPVIALDGYEYGIRSWAVAPFFCLFTIPTGVIMAWLRFRSGCIWPAVIMHAAINAEASVVLLALAAAPSMLIGAPIGLLGMAPFWVAAIWVIMTGRLTPPPEMRGA